MADALISVVLDQLASYVQNEVRLVVDTREEVVKLTSTLKMVQAVLADADEKQIKNKAVRLWLDDLKQVVYDADDVLDEWCTRTQVSKTRGDVVSGTRNKVLSSFVFPWFCFKNVIVHYDIGQQIKDINRRIDVIAKQRIDFGLKVVYQNHDAPRRLTSSVVDVSKIHGRDQAKEDIMSRLLGESSNEGIVHRVIAIVGIGGIGKTTLAKLIFNEERVTESFKTKMWVCVSQPFDLVGVAKAIIKEAKGDVPDSGEWQEVHECLCHFVKGKHFLLVLDDVWTEDPGHWNELKLALIGGASESRIIVTTRNRTVATIMGSTDLDIHELERLSDEDSWSVLKDIALVGKGEELEKFEKMGKEIAIKCKGVPLAIILLATLLYGKQAKQDWKNVLASDIWEMPEIENFFLPSLFLSYYSLPPISKQCFLYCAIFPKDTKLEKDHLIQLWMAQGFLGYEEMRKLEGIGESHFHILAARSFLYDFEKDSEGNIKSCKMHVLVHEFAMFLSQNECFVVEKADSRFSNDKIRHLRADVLEIPIITKAKSLRTFICRYLETAVPNELFDKLRSLRSLDLSHSRLEELPNEVEKLVHLRFLDLSCTELLELPETICNLHNSQFLGLAKCENLYKLPEKIGRLSNLRYLQIEETDSLSYFPKSIAALSSLRSLSKFIVSGEDHGCKIRDIQLLNNLQGALELNGLGQVADEEDAIRAELNKKRHLQGLAFRFKDRSDVRIKMKKILEKLEPHEDLEILEISDYPDSQFPGWVQSCSVLTSIVEMRLYRCESCRELPAFGKLPFLQALVLEGISSVTRISNELYGFGVISGSSAQVVAFPKLRILRIEHMENLEEWDIPILKDTKIMPLLCKLKLKYCPMLRALPCLGSLESLERLSMKKLSSVVQFGDEFYGFGGSLGVQISIAFPKLKVLRVENFGELKEWIVPSSKDRKIMPLLSSLHLDFCSKLRALPHVWKMESLETLELRYLPSVERVDLEFLGTVSDNEHSLQDGVIFPKLRELVITGMHGLEEWSIPFVTPCLTSLLLSDFRKLKTLPTFSCITTLEFLSILYMKEWEGQEKIVINEKEGSGDSCSCQLSIGDCPNLHVIPNFMFSSSFKELQLTGDVGNLLGSYPADVTCFITKLYTWNLPHSRLPEGFNHFKALQSLVFSECKTLDFVLNELGHFTMLQDLAIFDCPILRKRFVGDDWRTILAHVSNIIIDGVELTKEA